MMLPLNSEDRDMTNVTGGSVRLLSKEEMVELSETKAMNPRTLNSK